MMNDFLGLLELFCNAIENGKEKLKEILITLYTEKGDFETVEKIKEKGLPNALHVYGEKYTCIKSPFIFIQTSPIVPKGTIICVYNLVPQFHSGGVVSGKSEILVNGFNGREFVIPTVSHGAQPYDNDQYMFRDID